MNDIHKSPLEFLSSPKTTFIKLHFHLEDELPPYPGRRTEQRDMETEPTILTADAISHKPLVITDMSHLNGNEGYPFNKSRVPYPFTGMTRKPKRQMTYRGVVYEAPNINFRVSDPIMSIRVGTTTSCTSITMSAAIVCLTPLDLTPSLLFGFSTRIYSTSSMIHEDRPRPVVDIPTASQPNALHPTSPQLPMAYMVEGVQESESSLESSTTLTPSSTPPRLRTRTRTPTCTCTCTPSSPPSPYDPAQPELEWFELDHLCLLKNLIKK